MLDLQIIGGGPAGLTAALYAARSGLTVRVYDRTGGGGQMLEAAEVENYPGAGKVAGGVLAAKFVESAKAAGADIVVGEVAHAERKNGIFCLTVGGFEERSRALILANGAEPRRLAVRGEIKFLGRGVSYCAICDGRFFTGKTVAVVGGGDSALTEALYLSKIAARVYVIHRRAEFRGSPAILRALEALPQVVLLRERRVEEIFGEARVEGVRLVRADGSAAEALLLDAVFVAIGRIPENAAFSNLSTPNVAGYMAAGENCKTGVPGFFVAGDTREKSLRQIVTASADGAMAAAGVEHFLKKQSFPPVVFRDAVRV